MDRAGHAKGISDGGARSSNRVTAAEEAGFGTACERIHKLLTLARSLTEVQVRGTPGAVPFTGCVTSAAACNCLHSPAPINASTRLAHHRRWREEASTLASTPSRSEFPHARVVLDRRLQELAQALLHRLTRSRHRFVGEHSTSTGWLPRSSPGAWTGLSRSSSAPRDGCTHHSLPLRSFLRVREVIPGCT